MMMDKILVAFAGRAGSTAEIARAIGETLAASGAQVDVLPVKQVHDLAPYQAVVLGSAVRKFKWLPEASGFVQAHAAELSARPLAIFTVGISLAVANNEKSRQAVAKWVEPVRAQVSPLSEGYFAGVMDLSKLPRDMETRMLGVLVALGVFPRDDRRDWKAIRAWAEGLLPLLALKKG